MEPYMVSKKGHPRRVKSEVSKVIRLQLVESSTEYRTISFDQLAASCVKFYWLALYLNSFEDSLDIFPLIDLKLEGISLSPTYQPTQL